MAIKRPEKKQPKKLEKRNKWGYGDSPYHKQSKKDDSTTPNICPATIVLLSLEHKCKNRAVFTAPKHSLSHTYTHTNTEREATYPYDLWASIVWGSINKKRGNYL